MTPNELVKFDPFNELQAFQDDMNHLFSDFFGRVPAKRSLTEGLWAPLMDIEETKDELVIKAEVPGMTKDDIKIQINNDILSISGERKHEEETRDKTYHRIERTYGKFQRIIRMPTEVQSDKTKAAYENGVLTIRIPKSEKVKPREISIEVK
ncbi:MAG TPA: Hsp20/alpha crystallin family protein [Candidatus Edwardsbacteria bacterium]|nr:Hsp20/alpha crystallin family protein [Candidatus Edwardsbacteria bacterium]